MRCVFCFKLVEDQGPTLPKAAHLRCAGDYYERLKQDERAMFRQSIPRGATTIQFRKWAPLTTAMEARKGD